MTTIEIAVQDAAGARQAGERAGRAVEVTFHRAFDLVPDRLAALDTLIGLGYTRVLTSGGAPSVPEGLTALSELASHAAGRSRSRPAAG